VAFLGVYQSIATADSCSAGNSRVTESVGKVMTYTELDLAQLERRVAAGERCVSRQKDILKRYTDAGLPTDAALQLLAEFEVTLWDLRRTCNRIRDDIAAANTQQLLDSFWLLPARQDVLGNSLPSRN
jgi:hypothetical protein